MDNKPDKVFLVLARNHEWGMPVLEWAFDHFDSNETKIILAPDSGGDLYKYEFKDTAEKYYLPKCGERKFGAEILLPQEKTASKSILELLNKHGMRNFVTWAHGWATYDFSKLFDKTPCNIWIVNHDKSLDSVRGYNAIALTITEVEKLKKMSKEDAARFEKEKKKLHSEIKELQALQVTNNQTWNATKESLKNEKEEKDLRIKYFEDLQVINEQKLNETLESLKKEKEEKELQIKQAQDLLQINEQTWNNKVESLKKEKDLQIKQAKTNKKKKIKQVKDLQLINEQKWIESLKNEKKEKELLCQENEELKQRISILKYDSELALLDKAALATIKDSFNTLQSDYVRIQDERDNVVKEAEKLRNQIKLARTSNFTWQELKKATQDFSESLKIGEGGYARVYKGDLRGTDVAIKTLIAEKTAPLSAFKQEVAILTTFRHPNLVTLIGACYEHSALVYEFLPNGSLENHLNPANNITPLTWQVRTRIMYEICLALIFLHSNKPNLVIHGDLKPDNVLLDANFVSKLGDFGISRLIKRSETDATVCYRTSTAVGTPGYMDPDFVYNGQLTEKSDVFAFGVIMLRLLTGQSASGVVYRIQDAMQSETLDKMIDQSAGGWPFDQAKKLAVLGLRCTEMSRNDRPNLFNEVWPIIESLRRNIY